MEYFRDRLRNNIKLLVAIIGVPADIRNGKLPSTSHNMNSLIQLTAFVVVAELN